MRIPIMNGIYTDTSPDYRVSYPRNYMVVPRQLGLSNGYLRPMDGIVQLGTASGSDRGAIRWKDAHYRVMGHDLLRIAEDGTATVVGTIPGSGQVSMNYSFDRLGIAADGKLFYYNGFAVQQVTDPDLGSVIDVEWVDGYFMTTDGTNLVVTELTDPTQVNPLKYGSSEADPDPIRALVKVGNEIHALNQHTIEVFQNVGGNTFPFQRIEGAMIQKGVVGTHACSRFMDALAFVGNGREGSPAVWLGAGGQAAELSTREIAEILQTYTEQQLATCVVEAREDKSHKLLYIHLPDQTLVYDGASSRDVDEKVWFILDSGSGPAKSQYRLRNHVFCFNKWYAADPTSGAYGRLDRNISTHYGSDVASGFDTVIIYNEGMGGVVHDLELIGLPGSVPLGVNPTVWNSYSTDGKTFSVERPVLAGAQGNYNKRIAWRRQGKFRHWIIQRFRTTSSANIPFARLEAQIEPLLR